LRSGADAAAIPSQERGLFVTLVAVVVEAVLFMVALEHRARCP
jgi:hypothetical protein